MTTNTDTRCVHNQTIESGCNWCRIYAEEHPSYDKDTQPTPTATREEKWCVVRLPAETRDAVITKNRNDKLICEALPADAEQIVADHQHAELVAGLVEALNLVQRLLTNQTACEQSLCTSCNEARQSVLEAVNEALEAKGVTRQ